MDVHPDPSDSSNWDRNAIVYDAGPVEKLEHGPRIDNISESGGKVVATNTGSAALAMATAHIIRDITAVQYPAGVERPRPELNQNAKEGKFRYDREFLLQFRALCEAKPTTLRRLDDIGLDPKDQVHISRCGSDHPSRKSLGTGAPSRQGTIGLGFSSAVFGGKGATSFRMGNLGAMGTQYNREHPMSITQKASQADPNAIAKRTRTRPKRGGKLTDISKAPGAEQQKYENGIQNQQAMNIELVALIQTSAKRWDMKAPIDAESPEMAVRKIKCLVNKLTMEKFDSISNQIIAWINKSENEKHEYTLIQTAKLVVGQAMNEPMWSEMFARLCCKIMEQIGYNIKDDSIEDNTGEAIAGGQLFRKHLLSCCKDYFDRRWGKKDTRDRSKEDGRNDSDKVASTLLQGFCAGQEAKRPGLGLIKFISELYKFEMLTERIVHEFVAILLSGNVDNPEDEEIEPLCKLLTAVGGILDTPKARAHIEVYFSRMKELTKSLNINARMQYMLLDLIELRERKWVSRTSLAAAREKMVADRVSQRLINMSTRSRFGRGRGGYNGRTGSDGRTVGNTSGSSGPDGRSPPKAGDLSNFGEIKKDSVPTTFGPTSVFSGKNKNKRESISHISSPSNSGVNL